MQHFLMYICKGKSCTYFRTLFYFLEHNIIIHISMQCYNYISDVYNKPNRLKIGWKLSKLLFTKYMYHYQHNVMGEQADCRKMAAMCGRSRLRRKTSSVYIYLRLESPLLIGTDLQEAVTLSIVIAKTWHVISSRCENTGLSCKIDR